MHRAVDGVGGAPGSRAAVHGGDPFLPERCLDPHAADVHVQEVGIEPPLNHGRRKVDSFRGQVQQQRLGNDSPAHVAAPRADAKKVARLEQVELEFDLRPLRRLHTHGCCSSTAFPDAKTPGKGTCTVGV